MKSLTMLCMLIMLTGCTYTTHMNTGNQFSSDKVALIQKQKTTDKELIALLGQPTTKTVISETDVKWIYSYTDGSASAQAFTAKTTSNFTVHTLDILIRDGVVLNFVENHAPVNTNLQTQSGLN